MPRGEPGEELSVGMLIDMVRQVDGGWSQGRRCRTVAAALRAVAHLAMLLVDHPAARQRCLGRRDRVLDIHRRHGGRILREHRPLGGDRFGREAGVEQHETGNDPGHTEHGAAAPSDGQPRRQQGRPDDTDQQRCYTDHDGGAAECQTEVGREAGRLFHRGCRLDLGRRDHRERQSDRYAHVVLAAAPHQHDNLPITGQRQPGSSRAVDASAGMLGARFLLT